MNGERKLYNTMRQCSISTLDVHRVLEEIGIDIPQRTLQMHLDNDMTSCKDDRIEKVIKKMITNHKKLIENLKKSV